jgi:hypothetical protein
MCKKRYVERSTPNYKRNVEFFLANANVPHVLPEIRLCRPKRIRHKIFY